MIKNFIQSIFKKVPKQSVTNQIPKFAYELVDIKNIEVSVVIPTQHSILNVIKGELDNKPAMEGLYERLGYELLKELLTSNLTKLELEPEEIDHPKYTKVVVRCNFINIKL